MKKQRESSSNQIGLAEKQNLVAAYAASGATHVDCNLFTASNARLIARGFTPSPLTIEAETQQWYDVIHAQPNVYGSSVYGGYLKVLDRAIFPEAGDNNGTVVGFPIETSTPVGSAASAATDGETTWCGRWYTYLSRVSTRIQTGDVHIPFAEITARLFSGTLFASQSEVFRFTRECHVISNAFAAANGATITFFNNPNFSEITSGYWGAYTDTSPNLSYDYYGGYRGGNGLATFGTDVTPAGYQYDIDQTYAGISLQGYGLGTGGYKHMWGEWGDLAGSIALGGQTVRSGDNFVNGTTTIEQWHDYWIRWCRAITTKVNQGKIMGLSIWGGWEGQNTSILGKTGSGAGSQYYLNSRGQILQQFFLNGKMDRLPSLTYTPTTYSEGTFCGRDYHF